MKGTLEMRNASPMQALVLVAFTAHDVSNIGSRLFVRTSVRHPAKQQLLFSRPYDFRGLLDLGRIPQGMVLRNRRLAKSYQPNEKATTLRMTDPNMVPADRKSDSELAG